MIRFITLVAAVLSVAGCTGGPSPVTTTAPSKTQPQKLSQEAIDRSMETMFKSLGHPLAPGTRTYLTDIISVQDGSELANFPSSSKIVRSGSAVTIVDADSGQTFKFSANAVITTQAAAGRLYLPPGRPIPAWARDSNARAEVPR